MHGFAIDVNLPVRTSRGELVLKLKHFRRRTHRIIMAMQCKNSCFDRFAGWLLGRIEQTMNTYNSRKVCTTARKVKCTHAAKTKADSGYTCAVHIADAAHSIKPG